MLFRSPDGGPESLSLGGKATRIARHDPNTTDGSIQDVEERVRDSHLVSVDTLFNVIDAYISVVLSLKAKLTLVVETPLKWGKSLHSTSLFKIHETFMLVTPLCWTI